MKTSRSIKDYNIITVILSVGNSLFGNYYGIYLSHFKDLYICLFTDHLKLINSSRTIYITSHKKRSVTFLLEVFSKLCGMCCLTGTLKSAHHNYARSLGRHIYSGIGISHKPAKLVSYDFNNLLSGR